MGACLFEFFEFWDFKKYKGPCLHKIWHFINYIAIGTQLVEIYHVSYLALYALTNFSFFSFGAKWSLTNLTIDC